MNNHHGHMLKYHVILPAIVLAVLVDVGTPVSSALGAAMGAGGIAMMVMMGVMALGAVRRLRPHAEIADEAPTH